jgi:hypothetical protein
MNKVTENVKIKFTKNLQGNIENKLYNFCSGFILYILKLLYCNLLYCIERVVIAAQLTDKPRGKRPLGSSRRRWEGDIRIYFKEIHVILGIGLIRLRTRFIGESL